MFLAQQPDPAGCPHEAGYNAAANIDKLPVPR
jgi:hypothetical protein